MILPRMNPQAVHIEYLDDLTTNAFIRAFKMLDRSNQHSKLVGERDELANAMRKLAMTGSNHI